MPNLDAPNGFSPSRHQQGGVVRYDGGYSIASGLAEDLFLGDPVSHAGTARRIIQATGGDMAPTAVLGIFAGCRYTAANGDVVWAKQWVSGTTTLGGEDAEAFVYTDPNIIYTVQVNGTLTTADEIGLSFNFDDATIGAGNTATGISAVELLADPDGGNDGVFKLLGLATQPEGIFEADISAANPRVEVRILTSALNAET